MAVGGPIPGNTPEVLFVTLFLSVSVRTFPSSGHQSKEWQIGAAAAARRGDDVQAQRAVRDSHIAFNDCFGQCPEFGNFDGLSVAADGSIFRRGRSYDRDLQPARHGIADDYLQLRRT